MVTNEEGAGMRHTSQFTSELEVGQKVTGTSTGPGYATTWSGIYEGVVLSEWDDHEPVHAFRDGLLGETPQNVFRIPVNQFVDA